MIKDINSIIESIESHPASDSGSPGYNIKIKELIHFSKKQSMEIEILKNTINEIKRKLEGCKYPDGVPDHVYYGEVRRSWLYLNSQSESE